MSGGIIDGAAPPFIMLALTAAIMAALLTFSSYAALRPHLRVVIERWLLGYSFTAVILTLLVIARIAARGRWPTSFDYVILILTTGILSVFGVFSLFAWRHAEEFSV